MQKNEEKEKENKARNEREKDEQKEATRALKITQKNIKMSL